MITFNKFQKQIKVDFSDDSQLWLSNDKSLKILAGVLGIILPILLLFLQFTYTKHHEVLSAQSTYFFTRFGSILVMIVSLMAFILVINKGESSTEFWLSTLSGFCALLLILFPTSAPVEFVENIPMSKFVTTLPIDYPREFFHYVCAGIFLLGLALISLLVFPFNYQNGKKKKKKKNSIVYQSIGFLMIIVCLCVFIFHKSSWYISNNLTFWFESIAVWLFGVSWLLKAFENK